MECGASLKPGFLEPREKITRMRGRGSGARRALEICPLPVVPRCCCSATAGPILRQVDASSRGTRPFLPNKGGGGRNVLGCVKGGRSRPSLLLRKQADRLQHKPERSHLLGWRQLVPPIDDLRHRRLLYEGSLTGQGCEVPRHRSRGLQAWPRYRGACARRSTGRAVATVTQAACQEGRTGLAPGAL